MRKLLLVYICLLTSCTALVPPPVVTPPAELYPKPGESVSYPMDKAKLEEMIKNGDPGAQRILDDATKMGCFDVGKFCSTESILVRTLP